MIIFPIVVLLYVKIIDTVPAINNIDQPTFEEEDQGQLHAINGFEIWMLRRNVINVMASYKYKRFTSYGLSLYCIRLRSAFSLFIAHTNE
jgi:hypothetical protein